MVKIAQGQQRRHQHADQQQAEYVGSALADVVEKTQQGRWQVAVIEGRSLKALLWSDKARISQCEQNII
ncbi:hypothetical protein [Ferrimonas marina]|uniref:hypothetical protein n=1 Tax=Ferrimonas marina TaxID=299255 RepID=UPI001356572C|nr:hypothetical protein [Ferrimonas marina]